MGCPHADVVDCPLYHAMHVAGASSCWHRDLFNGCAVEHGAPYERLVAALRVQWPGFVDEVAFNAERRAIIAQRSRNQRAAGLH